MTRLSELARARIAALSSVVGLMRAYATFGLVMMAILMALSLWYYEDDRARWICRSASMACTLGSLAALNVMNRLIGGKTGAFVLFTVGLVLVALGLAAMSLAARRHGIGAWWTPFVAAVFLVVLARIFVRLRGTGAWEKPVPPTPSC